MGDKWDFQQRRMDIAWELAKMRIGALSRWQDRSERAIADELNVAWRCVEEAFPSPQDRV